ncbi:polysaccharide pyruvyl transferase family protein [Paenibacillus sp. HB172176]|uniref:polysaccharide pyruvyl transferase family protein n=1 Tax=Paenibacillus sp. HB172176 TaxID=2493690 RepID=UPI001438B533|nr:polysaccharide pyruvyl transferase family protein [Paenibacillus sp. HB172176]
MAELKERLKQILTVIPPGSTVQYIDYPVYNNGGDLLIMKGTEAFFKANRISVHARYSVLDFPDSLMIPRNHIIVLQGGGNFGDLYEVHQTLRERVVAAYPNNRIVILPQTIYYKEEEQCDKTAAILNRHMDLHLFVRDPNSYQIAKSKFHACSIYLSPDMAHQLWPIPARGAAGKALLQFLRTDIEQASEQSRIGEVQAGDSECLDWASLYNRVERRSIKLIGSMMSRKRGIIPMEVVWGKYSDYLVDKAIRRFSRYQAVQTSRLHGHILSCLMDKPNTLLDNSYGKNSSYFYTWTSDIDNVRLISSTNRHKKEEWQ